MMIKRNDMERKIFLASASPRRSEILKLAGLDFQVITPSCDENIDKMPPGDYVKELSARKARAGYDMVLESGSAEDFIVIGADTIVYFDGQILGKPHDEDQAFKMLHALSGNTHEVYTGVSVVYPDHSFSFYEKTDVRFFDVEDEELRAYIKTGEPMDKAGAYGIQGRGCFLAEKICGDYFNVMGLPAARLLRKLKENERDKTS